MENGVDEEGTPLLLERRPAPLEESRLWNRFVWKNGVFLMSIASILFPLVLAIVKEIEDRVPELQILWVRGLFVCVGAPLAAKIFTPGVSIFGKKENLLLLGILGTTGFGQTAAVWASVAYVPLTETVAILFCNSTITASLAAIMGLDKWSKITPIAVVLSVMGVLLVTRPALIFSTYAVVWDSDRILGLSFAAASTLGVSIILLISRKLSHREGGLTILFWQCLVTLCLSTASLALGFPAKPVFQLPLSDFAWMVVAAVSGTVPWFLLYRSVQLTSATVGSVLCSTQLVWSFLFDMLMFGEPFSVLSMVGCLCVVGASVIIAFTVVRKDRSITEVDSAE